MCINCGVCMGKYYCSKCKFFDDDVSCFDELLEQLDYLLLVICFIYMLFLLLRFQRINTTAKNVESAG